MIQRVDGYLRRKRLLRVTIAQLIEETPEEVDPVALLPDVSVATGFTTWECRFELQWQLGMYSLPPDEQ